MRYSKRAAVLLLAVCIALLLSTSLYITSLTVSGSDALSYLIVPTLMLPVFAILCSKESLEIELDAKSVLLGALLFAFFIVVVIILRLRFSFLFVSFRTDLVLFPFAVSALAVMLFGTKSVSKFKYLIAYPLISSPIVLLPLLLLFNPFTTFNTLVVYHVLKTFIPGMQFIAPVAISANGYNIGIGEACVSLGIFIALALFLVPVAYYYEGSRRSKALWLVSAVALLLLLNIARMLAISYVWLSSGPNAAALAVHTFIGVLLFYLVIAAMLLLSSRYGLAVPKPKKSKKAGSASSLLVYIVISLALALSLLYFFLTLNYSTATVISPLAVEAKAQFNFTNTSTSQYVFGLVASHGFTGITLNPSGNYGLLYLVNATIPPSNPLLLEVTTDSGVIAGIEKNNTLKGSYTFVDEKGFSSTVLDVVSQGTEYFAYASELPISLPGPSLSFAGFYLIIPASVLPSMSCSYDHLYSALANVFALQSHSANVLTPTTYSTNATSALSAFCFGEKVLS